MMVAAEPMVPQKKLKIKIGSRRIEAVECVQQFSIINDWGYGEKSSMPGVNKRGPQELIEDQPKKRLKMDRGVTQQCSVLLKALMKHRFGWVFNQPVDPVKLNIPDYFSVISQPMDLGTIKSKLEKNMYLGTEEFVADIRLTFSNAMLYNPPSNDVHQMAEELKKVFEVKWKALEEKWNSERSKVGFGKILSGRLKEVNGIGQNGPKTPPLCMSSLLKKSKPGEEKYMMVSLDARPMVVTTKVKLPKPAQSLACKLSGKSLHKGTGTGARHACGSATVKPPLSPVARNCGSCGSITCQCSNHTCSNDISSERSWGEHVSYHTGASKLAKGMSASQMSKSDPDSDGASSSMDDENACPSPQPTISAIDGASGEGWPTPIFDIQMSPKKALRAAMLKRQFADTILKAQQKTLLDHSKKADPVKMQLEKERLEKRHCEEKAKIEAEIKAAEAASRMRAEIEVKRQREREREAARIAVQKIEKTVEIEENLEVLKELERLCGSAVVMRAYRGAHLGHSLEQFGLFIKDDYLVDEDEEAALNGDGEEGEIFA